MPATMHRFKKRILRAGKHNAVKNGSTREIEDIPLSRVKKWVDSFNQMKSELGYSIPNPSIHYDKDGVVPKPVTISENGELLDPVTGKRVPWDASLNLGFWDKLDLDGEGYLIGEVEAPGDPDDPNTPAGKIGKTIKETSIGAAKKYVDGNGKEWDDVLVHIASCVHAVEPNQENFIPQKEGQYTLLSMSTLMDSDSPNIPGNTGETNTSDSSLVGDIGELLKILKKFAIDLPEDTSQDNFVERLTVAVKQKLADRDEQDEKMLPKPPKPAEPSKQPPNSTEKTGVVTMSTETKTDPNDNLTLSIAMSAMAETKREGLKVRLEKVIAKRILKQEDADKLFADLEMLTMSAEDFDQATGKFKETKFEFGLKCLEAVCTSMGNRTKEELLTMTSELTKGYDPKNGAKAPEDSVEHEHEHMISDEDDYEAEDEDSAMMKAASEVIGV